LFDEFAGYLDRILRGSDKEWKYLKQEHEKIESSVVKKRSRKEAYVQMRTEIDEFENKKHKYCKCHPKFPSDNLCLNFLTILNLYCQLIPQT
jgi:hypothetical protein